MRGREETFSVRDARQWLFVIPHRPDRDISLSVDSLISLLHLNQRYLSQMQPPRRMWIIALVSIHHPLLYDDDGAALLRPKNADPYILAAHEKVPIQCAVPHAWKPQAMPSLSHIGLTPSSMQESRLTAHHNNTKSNIRAHNSTSANYRPLNRQYGRKYP